MRIKRVSKRSMVLHRRWWRQHMRTLRHAKYTDLLYINAYNFSISGDTYIQVYLVTEMCAPCTNQADRIQMLAEIGVKPQILFWVRWLIVYLMPDVLSKSYICTATWELFVLRNTPEIFQQTVMSSSWNLQKHYLLTFLRFLLWRIGHAEWLTAKGFQMFRAPRIVRNLVFK